MGGIFKFSNKKFLLVFILLLFLITMLVVFRGGTSKSSLQTPLSKIIEEKVQVTPSETTIDYSDPTGFSFSYPDNLSLTNNEIEGNNTYADIQLFGKGINGSLSLKVKDTKLKNLDEWLKENLIPSTLTPKEVFFGGIKAIEIKTPDRFLMAGIDQGILFTIEIPLIEESFWMKVYEKILSNFAFTAPSQGVSTQGAAVGSNDVSFEGEEVVED